MTRLAYQKLKAKAHVAGGVPVLNATDGCEHKRLVQEALARGERVLERVLEAYPELSISAALERSEVETLTENQAMEILDQTLRPDSNPAQTLTGDVLDAMERVAKAEIVPEDLPPAQFKKQLAGEAAEALLAKVASIVPEMIGFGGDDDTPGSEPVEKTASDADTAGESSPDDQAEFGQWELQLLTGLVDKPGSVFYKALKAVTRPGALHLALERIEGDQRRCELIEHRLMELD